MLAPTVRVATVVTALSAAWQAWGTLACQRFRVRRLELFGSAAAGGFDPHSSDLDFLVEFDDLQSNEYADASFGLLEALEKLFRRDVDLVVARYIRNPCLRESMQRSRTLLYAV